MNKKNFIKNLSDVTGYSLEKCSNINSIIEEHFIVGKNNKDIIINDLNSKLKISLDEADEIYNNVMSILATEIKDKIKHPFKAKIKM